MADTDKIYNSIAAEKARAQYVKNLMGAADGIATLDSSGLVPSEQLPSYIDDIVELVNITDTAPSTCSKGDWYFNTTTSKLYKATAANTWGVTAYNPEKSKIYFNKTDEKSYRWGGSAMAEIPSSNITGIKVGASGTLITPSQGVITIPVYETGAQVHIAPTSTEVKEALGTVSTSEGNFLKDDGTWDTPQDTTYQLSINGTAAGDTTSGTNLGSVYAPTSAGTEGQMLIANASGIPTWGSKPSYAYGEIGYEIATQTTSGAISVNGTKPLHIITLSGAATSVAFSSGNLPAVGHLCHIIFKAATATTVSIAHVSTGSVRYVCPGGESPDDIEVPAGGYVEIDLLRGADTEENNETVSWVYVRGI